ncbi:hypothetical protein Tco_0946971 [Tanacetum coccineum]
MNQEEIRQVTARDEKWVPAKEIVKSVPPTLNWKPLCHKRKKPFKLSSMSSRTLPATRHSPFLLKSLKYLCSSSGTLLIRIQGEDFTQVPDDENTLTFLIDLGYKGPLCRPHASTLENSGCYYPQVKNVDYPELIWEFQIDHMQLKKGRHENMPYPRFTKIIINHFVSKHQSLTKLQYLHTYTIKDDGVVSRLKFVRISKDFQEYGLPIPETMLTEGIKQSESYQMFTRYSTGLLPPEKSRGKGSQGKKTADTPEAAVDVFEESYSEPARKQTSSRRVIKKKVSISVDDNIIPEPDVALELGKSTRLAEATKEEAARQVHVTHERIATESDLEPARRRPSGIAFRDTSSMSKKLSLDPSQKLKGVLTLTPEEQLDVDTMQAHKESKKISRRQPNTKGSSEGTGSIPGIPNESTLVFSPSNKGTEGNDDENIKWVDTNEEEEKNDDNDDKNIDLEKTNDEETNDEFVHIKEYVQDDDEEIDDETVHEITDAAKADAEKAEEVKDDTKKVELPPSGSSLYVSSGFGNQFLNLSSNTSLIGTIMDTTDAEINSLLDVQIQQEIPHIQSPSVLTVLVSVISKPSVLIPIPKTPSVAPATTLLPPTTISSISHKYVQELKETDNTTTLRASLRSEIPSAVNAYLGSIDYKEKIEEFVKTNIINDIKNQLPKFLPKAVSDFSTPVIQSTVKNALKKTLLPLAQSSSQAQSSLKVAESLSEYELKTILFDKMDKSYPEKVLRKRDRDNEDPSAGPNQEPVFEMASDDIEQTIDDVANDVDQPPDESTQTKDKDLNKYWFKQSPMPPTLD